MNYLRSQLHLLETTGSQWLVKYSLAVLRVSLGLVFLGFGFLKYFPNLSPAQDLVIRTMEVLTFGLVPAHLSVILVATLECTIGLGLISGRYLRLTLALLAFQMVGAMSPLFLFSGEIFGGSFHAPTLEGQYIIKDIILISAGLVLGATLHGGRIVTERVRRAEDYKRYAPAVQASPESPGRSPDPEEVTPLKGEAKRVKAPPR